MVWDIIKGIGTWMWNNKNIAAYLILTIVIAFLTWRNNNLKIDLEQQIIERGKLPDNIEFIGEMRGTKFKLTYRDSNGNIVHKEYYVPREGGVKFTKYIDLKQYDAKSGFSGASLNPSIKPPSLNPLTNFIDRLSGKNPGEGSGPGGTIQPVVKVFGFTFRPGVSAIYDGGFKPERPVTVAIDAKLFYISRWSSGVGTTLDYPEIFISRHIDDLVPFIPVENLEIMVLYGKPYSNFSNSVFGVGGRTNF